MLVFHISKDMRGRNTNWNVRNSVLQLFIRIAVCEAFLFYTLEEGKRVLKSLWN